MTWEKFTETVVEELCKHRGTPKEEIISEVEKEHEWLKEFYDKGKASGDFAHAKDLAVANFSLWV